MASLSLHSHNWLSPLRKVIDQIQIRDTKWAHILCRMIPNQCPFSRDIHLCGRVLFRIPPLCKLNPLYDEVMGLKVKAATYLSEQGEDISVYFR